MSNAKNIKIEDVLNIKDNNSHILTKVDEFFDDMLIRALEINPYSFSIVSDMHVIQANEVYLATSVKIAQFIFQVVFKQEMKLDLDKNDFDLFLYNSLVSKKDDWVKTGRMSKELKKILYGISVKDLLRQDNFEGVKDLVENPICLKRLNMEIIKARKVDPYILLHEQKNAIFDLEYAKEMIVSDSKEIFLYAIEQGLDPRINNDELLFYSILYQNYFLANKLIDCGCSVYSQPVLKAQESPEYKKVELYENLNKMQKKAGKSANKI